jgi:hypothetical protein
VHNQYGAHISDDPDLAAYGLRDLRALCAGGKCHPKSPNSPKLLPKLIQISNLKIENTSTIFTGYCINMKRGKWRSPQVFGHKVR